MKVGRFYYIHVNQEPATLAKPLSPKPSPAPGEHYGEPPNCSLWQKIFPYDLQTWSKEKTCTELAKAAYVPLDTFMKWNPYVLVITITANSIRTNVSVVNFSLNAQISK
jgi:hypothetical protein